MSNRLFGLRQPLSWPDAYPARNADVDVGTTLDQRTEAMAIQITKKTAPGIPRGSLTGDLLPYERFYGIGTGS
jgi:hypothetical protein